jgi:hypothetical protein
MNGRRFLAPVLSTFVSALPHTFRNVDAEEGTVVQLVISGASGGSWCARREANGWSLYEGEAPRADSHVPLDQDTAWRLFTWGIDKESAAPLATVRGDRRLGLQVLETVSTIG